MPYIYQLIQEGRSEGSFYINHYTEKITVDEETKTVIEIFEDIQQRAESDFYIWTILQQMKKGGKDVRIIMGCPMSRAKYYVVKEHLINRIYECCVCRGLVSYEEILKEDIG